MKAHPPQLGLVGLQSGICWNGLTQLGPRTLVYAPVRRNQISSTVIVDGARRCIQAARCTLGIYPCLNLERFARFLGLSVAAWRRRREGGGKKGQVYR